MFSNPLFYSQLYANTLTSNNGCKCVGSIGWFDAMILFEINAIQRGYKRATCLTIVINLSSAVTQKQNDIMQEN